MTNPQGIIVQRMRVDRDSRPRKAERVVEHEDVYLDYERVRYQQYKGGSVSEHLPPLEQAFYISVWSANDCATLLVGLGMTWQKWRLTGGNVAPRKESRSTRVSPSSRIVIPSCR
jgi:hypothetical protein